MSLRRSPTPEIVLIVAVADNGVIGSGNAIPWRLKADQQRFKALTMGKPIVMGRRTFLSLKRPLAGRTNIVMTRDPEFSADGAVVTASVEHAYEAARGDALRRSVAEIAVIGGAEVYAQWIDVADRLEITEVHARPDGETRFDGPDRVAWREIARERHSAAEGDSADYSYVTYRRQ